MSDGSDTPVEPVIVLDANYIVGRCNAPAPAVVNGGGYLGCALDAGHDGQHSTTLTWGPG